MKLIVHEPVLLKEALDALNVRKNLLYVDATFGLGGYSKEILKKNECNLIAIDRDPDVEKYSLDLRKNYKKKFDFVLESFSKLETILKRKKIEGISGGIVADLGMSNLQIEQGIRGFSIKNNGPLDMRMSKEGLTADHIINFFEEKKLSKIFWEFGEEYKSKKIAKKIVYERKKKRISTTHDLANLIKKAKSTNKKYKIHPATKAFQALRIFINNELQEINILITTAFKLLMPGARLVLITFHSLEDRLVKNTFNNVCATNNTINRHMPTADIIKKPEFKKIGKSFYLPTDIEIQKNPKARSAKLRVIERVSI